MLKPNVTLIIFALSFFEVCTGGYALLAQKVQQQYLKEKVVKERKLKMKVQSIHAKGDKLAIVQIKNADKNEKVVSVFSDKGVMKWKKGVTSAHRVIISMAENSDKIVVISNYEADRKKNVCFDTKGKKIWEKWITDPGLTQSSNGRYGITTKIAGEDGGGSFEIFDMNTGEEVAQPILKAERYGNFQAQFLDSSNVVLLLVKDEMTQTGGTIQERIATMKRRLDLLVYDIANSRIKYRKILKTIEGNSLFMYSLERDNLAVSKTGRRLAIVARDIRYADKKNSTCIIQFFNEKLNLLSQYNSTEDHLNDLKFIDDEHLAIVRGRKMMVLKIATSELLLKNIESELPRHVISEAYKDNNKIFIQTKDHFRGDSYSSWSEFDAATGKLLKSSKNEKPPKVILKNNNGMYYYLNSTNTIQFLEN